LKKYLNINDLEREIKNNKSMICRSLLKYGYSSFSLEILEYCHASNRIEREQHYLDFLQPEYNILKVAGSRLGFKHSEETKRKMRAKALTSEWLERLKISNSSPEHKAKRLEHLNRLHASPEFQAKRLEQLKRLNSSKEQLEHLKNLTAKQSHQVSVLDTLTNERTVYSSIKEVVRAIGVTAGAISKAFKKKSEKGETNPTIEVKKKRYKLTRLSVVD
jgi:group I intron endonuclease